MAGKGGAVPGAGRKTNGEKYADKIASFTDKCASHLKPTFWRLWELIEGGERVEVKRVPSGLLTRKDVARNPDGTAIVDDKGKPTIVEVKVYPEVPDHEPVEVERKVTTLQPEIRAIQELLDRVMGKARQALELTGDGGNPIEINATVRSQATEELEAWRKQMIDRLSSLAKCSADYAYFIDSYGVIDDAQGHGDGSGTMRFRLWAAQVLVAWQLMTLRLIIILKARQLGISWLCCGYALWHCLFAPGKLVLLYSQGELEAIELLRRVKVLYERLPEWLKDELPAVLVDNTTLFGWDNGSRIQSLPATKKAGRGNAASLVIVDEAAFLQFADSLYTALKPTIAGGGQLVILSTANGIGNLFHRLWTRAAAGLNSFRTVFLPWWSRPGRDAAWYEAELADATDPAMVQQEYPADPNEAFVASGRVRFQSSWISAQAKHVRPGIPRSQWPESLRGIDGLTLYALPAPPWRPPMAKVKPPDLLLAADVAEGLEHGDFSAATMLDGKTWDELLDLHGHWEPDVYARHLHAIAEAYGAQVMVERNNHGHTTLSTLKSLGSRRIALGHDGRPGWLTNVKTKPQAVDALAVALRDDLPRFHNQAALDEMQVYQVLDDGGTGAPAGYHDDRVMCRAIALGAIKMGIGLPRKIEVS